MPGEGAISHDARTPDRQGFAELIAVDELLSSLTGNAGYGPRLVDLLHSPQPDRVQELSGQEYWSLAEATLLLRGWIVESQQDAERAIGTMRAAVSDNLEDQRLSTLYGRMEVACSVGTLQSIVTSSGTFVRSPEFLQWADEPPFPARFRGDPRAFPIDALAQVFGAGESYDEVKKALDSANARLLQLTSNLKGRRAGKLEDWTKFLWALGKSFQNRGATTREMIAHEIAELLDDDLLVLENAPSFDQLRQWIEDAELELDLPLARPKAKKGD